MKRRLQHCAWSQSAVGRRTPMHNIGAIIAVKADALLKDTRVLELLVITVVTMSLSTKAVTTCLVTNKNRSHSTAI